MSTTSVYSVTGMTCGHCIASVTEEIEALPGVSGIEVVLVPEGTSQVTVVSDAPLERGRVADAIDEAGYQVVDE